MSNIVIYGKGKTGLSLYSMLQKQGKQAVFYDDIDGFSGFGEFSDKSLVLLSPGVKPDAYGLKKAREAGARIVTELEFCFPQCSGRCVSVTGTNGKTTTCEMINHILKRARIPCRLLGNGGIPFSDEVLEVSPDEIVILENSSFQLTNAETFAPYISVFTSLACDHLDYHGNYENYVEAKVNNFTHMLSGYAIFNADDVNVAELSDRCRCKRIYYSTEKPDADCYYDGINVVLNVDGKTYKRSSVKLGTYARHNVSNALAAVLATYILGVPLSVSVDSLADYPLLPHRMQVVEVVDRVVFVDDSKATNVHAAVHAVTSFKQPLALILGGSDKGERFDEIFLRLPDNVAAVVASGDTARTIAQCGEKYGVKVSVFEDIQQATEYCFDVIKKKGFGVVLMSNACASFDKFKSYEERGLYFQQVVKGLNGGKKAN